MSTIRSILFLLAIFAIGFSLPLRAVFAASACTCTLTNKDCKTIFVDSKSDSTKGCKKLCSTDLGKNFQSASYGADTDAEAITYKCAQAHDAFVTEAKKASGSSSTSTTAKPTTASITPKLNVEIPELTFSPAIITGGTVKTSYLADYLNAIYKYLIGASFTFAVVMVMIGGFQYVLSSGGNSELQKKAKKRMTDAVTGLVLLLSVYLILYTTNPQLTLLKAINLENVDKVELMQFSGDTEENGSDTSSTPTPKDIFCPQSGGAAAIPQIVKSLQGKVVYRWGGKWSGKGPYGVSPSGKKGVAAGNPAWEEVVKNSKTCPDGLKCLDCSGFVSGVLSCAGIKISGGSSGLLNSGRKSFEKDPIDFNNLTIDGIPLKIGDLFGWVKKDAKDMGESMPGHVLIYVGKLLNGQPSLIESTGGKNGIGYKQGLNAHIKPFTKANIKRMLPGNNAKGRYYRFRRI